MSVAPQFHISSCFQWIKLLFDSRWAQNTNYKIDCNTLSNIILDESLLEIQAQSPAPCEWKRCRHSLPLKPVKTKNDVKISVRSTFREVYPFVKYLSSIICPITFALFVKVLHFKAEKIFCWIYVINCEGFFQVWNRSLIFFPYNPLELQKQPPLILPETLPPMVCQVVRFNCEKCFRQQDHLSYLVWSSRCMLGSWGSFGCDMPNILTLETSVNSIRIVLGRFFC